MTRLLDGGEEAELMLRGVASDLTLGAGTLVIDIGGGSTELVTTGSSRLEWATSTEAGSVRLTERFLDGDPPSEAELEACADHVRSLLPPLDIQRAVGVAGTVTTAAAIEAAGRGRCTGTGCGRRRSRGSSSGSPRSRSPSASR